MPVILREADGLFFIFSHRKGSSGVEPVEHGRTGRTGRSTLLDKAAGRGYNTPWEEEVFAQLKYY